MPLRMCVVCRELRPRAELFRFVKKKGEGIIRLDSEYARSGKGVYFCRAEECLRRLRKERRLRRLFLDKLSDGSLEWMLQEVGQAG